jgi:hypothetical protein
MSSSSWSCPRLRDGHSGPFSELAQEDPLNAKARPSRKGPKFRDGLVLPSVVQVLHDGKAFSPERGGGFSFALSWQSQTERSAGPSGPSPLQGQSPRSLTPPLAHSSPGSSPGSNAPNPLPGDGAIHGICKICKALHRLFGFHRGIGEGRGAGHAGGACRPFNAFLHERSCFGRGRHRDGRRVVARPVTPIRTGRLGEGKES